MSRILVIDDDPDLGRVIRRVLELAGYDVVLADDGLRGLAAAQRQRPDAIVLDLMMPVMDGFEVLAALANDARTRDVPVVVLSAMALEDARERARAAGAPPRPREAVRTPRAVGRARGAHRSLTRSQPGAGQKNSAVAFGRA